MEAPFLILGVLFAVFCGLTGLILGLTTIPSDGTPECAPPHSYD